MKGTGVKSKHVLIDFENVQPNDLTPLQKEGSKVTIFVGNAQAKLPTDLVCAVQKLGTNANYVQIEGNGPNALDFHIAYHLGRLGATTEATDFFIISKDTGFDPLLRHLKASGVSCVRLNSLASLPQPQPVIAKPQAVAVKPASDPTQKVLDNFAKRGVAKPRTLRTLQSSIQHLLGTEGTTETALKVIKELQRRRVIQVVDEKVTYPPTA